MSLTALCSPAKLNGDGEEAVESRIEFWKERDVEKGCMNEIVVKQNCGPMVAENNDKQQYQYEALFCSCYRIQFQPYGICREQNHQES